MIEQDTQKKQGSHSIGKFNEAVGKYRWTICGLIFFATTINYLDRAVISLLKSYLDKDFGWSESD